MVAFIPAVKPREEWEEMLANGHIPTERPSRVRWVSEMTDRLSVERYRTRPCRRQPGSCFSQKRCRKRSIFETQSFCLRRLPEFIIQWRIRTDGTVRQCRKGSTECPLICTRSRS